MKIELKDSEVGEFHDGRDTELWVATRWIVFSSSYCIVIKTKKKILLYEATVFENYCFNCYQSPMGWWLLNESFAQCWHANQKKLDSLLQRRKYSLIKEYWSFLERRGSTLKTPSSWGETIGGILRDMKGVYHQNSRKGIEIFRDS